MSTVGEERMGRTDRMLAWIEKHNPTATHELAAVDYEIKDVGPFSSDDQLKGAVIPLWFKVSAFLSMLIGGLFIYYTIDAPLALTPSQHDALALLTLVAGIGMFLATAVIAIHFWDGIGSHYKYFMLLHLWWENVKHNPVRVEWRTNDSYELWNPITKSGSWHSVNDMKTEVETVKLEEAREKLQQEVEALRKEKETLLVDSAVETGVKVSLAPTGERFGSMREVLAAARIMSSIVTTEEVKVKDDVKEVLAILERLAQIVEAIDLPYFVTLLDVEGPVYPVIISDHSLFGGEKDVGHGELNTYALSVRSWTPWAAKTVRNVCLASGVVLADYKFYVIPTQKARVLRQKEERIQMSPIIYLSHSDGTVREMRDEFKHNKDRAPGQNDVLQVELVYTASVADDQTQKVKQLTSRLDSKGKSEKEIRREVEAEAKNTVARGLELNARTGRVNQQGILSGLRNTSAFKVGKYTFYIVLAILAFIGLMAFFQQIGLLDLGWFTQQPTNGTVPGSNWGGVALDGLRYLRGLA